MGAIIVVAVVSIIFFVIYANARKESYGEDFVRNLPQTEGNITMVKEEGRFVKYNVEFMAGGRTLVGESITYVNPNRKYWEGCRVRFWYKMFNSGGCHDARIVLQDPELVSSDKKSVEKSWQILIFAVGFAVFDVLLMIWNILF